MYIECVFVCCVVREMYCIPDVEVVEGEYDDSYEQHKLYDPSIPHTVHVDLHTHTHKHTHNTQHTLSRREERESH